MSVLGDKTETLNRWHRGQELMTMMVWYDSRDIVTMSPVWLYEVRVYVVRWTMNVSMTGCWSSPVGIGRVQKTCITDSSHCCALVLLLPLLLYGCTAALDRITYSTARSLHFNVQFVHMYSRPITQDWALHAVLLESGISQVLHQIHNTIAVQ